MPKSKSFVLHKDSLAILKKMSDEQAGKLFKVIYEYQISEEIPVIDDALIDVLFIPFLNQFVRDKETYDTKCLKNSENAKVRWDSKRIQTDANAYNGIRTDANHADNKKDSDSDSDSDKENEYLTTFEKFRVRYGGKKRGSKTEFEYLVKTHKDWKEVVNILNPALDSLIKKRNIAVQNKSFCPEWKNLKTYIYNRSWEEEDLSVAPTPEIKIGVGERIDEITGKRMLGDIVIPNDAPPRKYAADTWSNFQNKWIRI